MSAFELFLLTYLPSAIILKWLLDYKKRKYPHKDKKLKEDFKREFYDTPYKYEYMEQFICLLPFINTGTLVVVSIGIAYKRITGKKLFS